jgi:TetR/AcrR family transcriptional repressor of nem operon
MNTGGTSKADEILDAAELRIRRGGFNDWSFRHLATDVGIKSASVHYHFPRKADLGHALITRYADRFLDALGEPGTGALPQQYDRLAAAYLESLEHAGTACLCAILGGAGHELPEPMRMAIADFYDRLVTWATDAFGPGSPDDEALAETVISALQGAMILAVAQNDKTTLVRVAIRLRTLLSAAPD